MLPQSLKCISPVNSIVSSTQWFLLLKFVKNKEGFIKERDKQTERVVNQSGYLAVQPASRVAEVLIRHCDRSQRVIHINKWSEGWIPFHLAAWLSHCRGLLWQLHTSQPQSIFMTPTLLPYYHKLEWLLCKKACGKVTTAAKWTVAQTGT